MALVGRKEFGCCVEMVCEKGSGGWDVGLWKLGCGCTGGVLMFGICRSIRVVCLNDGIRNVT